jgi:NADPH:quinone reductase-like Zn-dependent oxidoreductase
LNSNLIIKNIPILEADGFDTEIELKYAALNHRDLWIKKGQYAGINLPVIMGSDGSGHLNGKPVLINPSINWGDNENFQQKSYRILGLSDPGTFAEKVKIQTRMVHTKPDYLSFEEAAALPLAALTAYRALVIKCQPVAGEHVFISGVGGGVATFAFQMALALGCKVFVSSGSEWKRKRAIQMGAIAAYDYNDPDIAKKILSDSGGIDVIIDSAAGKGFSTFTRISNPGGRICIYGGTKGPIQDLNPQQIFWKQLHIMGSTMGSDADFEKMLQFVSTHQIRPIIDRVFKLDQINEALDYMEEGKQFGKIVIEI